MILAVDPGVKGHGVAVFGAKGELLGARYVEPDTDELWHHGRHTVPNTHGLTVPFEVSHGLRYVTFDEAVVEVPQVYALTKSKGGQAGQNDLIDVAFAAGWIVAITGLRLDRVQRVRPRQWKGSVPKAVMTKRIASKLTPAEQARICFPTASKTLGHNVLDAVGIGLWRVGRLGVR